MRIAALLTLPLLGALALAPRPASAQVSVTVRLGTPLVITQYSPDVHGDWHTAYRAWTPVTVYYFNGGYYSRAVKGGRPVQIYRQQNRYFLPPQDEAWTKHADKRFNYKRRPTDEDYQHAGPPPKAEKGHDRPKDK